VERWKRTERERLREKVKETQQISKTQITQYRIILDSYIPNQDTTLAPGGDSECKVGGADAAERGGEPRGEEEKCSNSKCAVIAVDHGGPGGDGAWRCGVVSRGQSLDRRSDGVWDSG
jgi:hypothetical protein